MLFYRYFHPTAMASNGSGFAVFIPQSNPGSCSGHRYVKGYTEFLKYAGRDNRAQTQVRLLGRVLFRDRWEMWQVQGLTR